MNRTNKLMAVVCCMLFGMSSMGQPTKSKPVAKPAPSISAVKIDYDKLKKEIRSLYQEEKHAAVIKKATTYLLKYPKDTAVNLQKAISHVSLKQYQTGFDMLKKFYVNVDTAGKYIGYIAFNVPEADLLTSGIACADESIRLLPNKPYGYFVKGGLYSDQGEHEKALPFMEQMNAKIVTDEEQLIFGQFYAKELAFNKQPEKALAAIDAIYKKFPKDKDVLFSYASIHRLNKSYDKAVEKYDQLIAAYPDDPDLAVQKIIALNLSGKTSEACATIDELVAKDGTYEFMRYRYKCLAYFSTPSISGFKKATWQVDANGNTYDFTVSNPKGSMNEDFEFDWSMTSSDDANGHVKITKTALEKAIVQNNYFSPSLKDVTFSEKTTVWVSKEVINQLIKNSTAKMDVGDGEEVYTVVTNDMDNRDRDALDEKFTINGASKYLNTLHVKNADGSKQLWILNDVANPMIIKMDIGFVISLKSID